MVLLLAASMEAALEAGAAPGRLFRPIPVAGVGRTRRGNKIQGPWRGLGISHQLLVLMETCRAGTRMATGVRAPLTDRGHRVKATRHRQV